MKDLLEKKVKKHIQKKKSFLIVAITFLMIGSILFMISLQADNQDFFWINFPTFILTAVLAIIYVSMFGLRKMEDALYEQEDEIDEAVARLYEFKTRSKTPRLELTEDEKLELLELEELKEKLKNEA